MEKKFIFVLQMEESGEIFIGRKGDIDAEIRNYENSGKELPWTTIGKIEEPPYGLPIGFEPELIQWFDKKAKPEQQIINQTVLAIIQFIR